MFFALMLLIGIIILIPATHLLGNDILEQKKDLEKIQKDIEKARENLNELKEAEQGMVREITDYEQRASMNQTILGRLNRQLTGLQRQIDSAKQDLDLSEQNHLSSYNRYLKSLRLFYVESQGERISMAGDIRLEYDALRRVKYLKAITAFDKEQLTTAREYLDGAEIMYGDLVTEEKNIDDLKRKKRSEYTIITSQKERKERDLYDIRRKKDDEVDRLVSLSEAAKRMEELVSRLEQERRARQRGQVDFEFETGNFATYKGILTAPITGKIISRFGWKTDKVTLLKSYSPGIEIQGRANASVKVSADGMVVYTGYIRGYGNFVIVEHEDGYYSTYAGLDKLAVGTNQILLKGETLGTTASGKIKFELRQGRQPLDPVEWIKIDAFK
jgi:septal ring factor EnvC (AmiA/AmiB activator)